MTSRNSADNFIQLIEDLREEHRKEIIKNGDELQRIITEMDEMKKSHETDVKMLRKEQEEVSIKNNLDLRVIKKGT